MGDQPIHDVTAHRQPLLFWVAPEVRLRRYSPMGHLCSRLPIMALRTVRVFQHALRARPVHQDQGIECRACIWNLQARADAGHHTRMPWGFRPLASYLYPLLTTSTVIPLARRLMYSDQPRCVQVATLRGKRPHHALTCMGVEARYFLLKVYTNTYLLISRTGARLSSHRTGDAHQSFPLSSLV